MCVPQLIDLVLKFIMNENWPWDVSYGTPGAPNLHTCYEMLEAPFSEEGYAKSFWEIAKLNFILDLWTMQYHLKSTRARARWHRNFLVVLSSDICYAVHADTKVNDHCLC